MLLLVGWRTHISPHGYTRDSRFCIRLFWDSSGALAMKLAFNPTSLYEGRGILRWFQIALLLAAGTVIFLKAIRNT
jgi:hypothetical protein